MSVGVLESADLLRAAVQAAEVVQTLGETAKWSPENFAREQIRGLVRQVFFSSAAQQVRQVVFCPAGSGTDVGNICWQVAEALALDTSGNVAVVSRDQLPAPPDQVKTEEDAATVGGDATLLRQGAIRIRRNLWWVPQNRVVEDGGGSSAPLSSRLSELRREFEYSIVQGPAAGESGEAAALGQSADGIIPCTGGARHAPRSRTQHQGNAGRGTRAIAWNGAEREKISCSRGYLPAVVSLMK